LKLLLDTHVFLWLQAAPERLGEHLGLLKNPRTEILVSAVVSWEIAIKYRLKRLSLPEPPQHYVPERLRAIGAQALPIEHTHTLAVAGLPLLHRDPFDRLLVAQAGLLKVPILTTDSVIARYEVETLMVE
jgi:PIN domain nuclease of toxin-antitoxin system